VTHLALVDALKFFGGQFVPRGELLCMEEGAVVFRLPRLLVFLRLQPEARRPAMGRKWSAQ
jgi:hypothetical protein